MLVKYQTWGYSKKLCALTTERSAEKLWSFHKFLLVRPGQTKQRNEKAFIMLKKLHQVLHFCACVLSVLQCRVQVFFCVCVWVLCRVASPRGGDGRRHGGLLSVKGRRVLIFNRGRLYLEPAASPSPWWTAQRRWRPVPLWRKAVGGSRTSLSLPDRISLQMSFKTRCTVFHAYMFVCASLCLHNL